MGARNRFRDRAAELVFRIRAARPGSAPGLILVQVDGLCRRHLEDALRAGRMPFLRGLLRREGYGLTSLYSGLPATTPAVQGEIFYGRRSAVPAYSFVDPESGKRVEMGDFDAAARVERDLASSELALLEGGSSSANMYSGGAAETRLCPATMQWSDVAADLNPLSLLAAAARNPFGAARIAWLVAAETAVALRELVTAGVARDAARGLPIIHANYLGYDEASHRRGPSSGFALRALPGIDAAIRRVWRAACRSRERDYLIWIFSDHGQEATTPWSRAIGPLGYLYPPRPLSGEGVEEAAAFTPRGRFRLPAEGAEVLGPAHPAGRAAARDLVDLLRHPAAGQILIGGWSHGAPRALSFVTENGGPGRRRPAEPPPHDLQRARVRRDRPPLLPGAGRAGHRPVRRGHRRPPGGRCRTREDGRRRPGPGDRGRAGHELPLPPGDPRGGRALRGRDPRAPPAAAGSRARLPGPLRGGIREPRGAIWGAVDIGGGRELNVINTHLGLSPAERLAQIDALLGEEWAGSPEFREPRVLCGDLNATRRSAVCRRLGGALEDVHARFGRGAPRGTYPSRCPIVRLDHIYVGSELEVLSVEIPRWRLARLASDHLPFIVDLGILSAVKPLPVEAASGTRCATG